MNNELEIPIDDFPTFSALNCQDINHPAIEEVDIKVKADDKNRFVFVYENTPEFQQKLSAFRRGELRVEPSQYFHVCKQLKQEIKYLKDSLT